jgi:hypothetical protein
VTYINGMMPFLVPGNEKNYETHLFMDIDPNDNVKNALEKIWNNYVQCRDEFLMCMLLIGFVDQLAFCIINRIIDQTEEHLKAGFNLLWDSIRK